MLLEGGLRVIVSATILFFSIAPALAEGISPDKKLSEIRVLAESSLSFGGMVVPKDEMEAEKWSHIAQIQRQIDAKNYHRQHPPVQLIGIAICGMLLVIWALLFTVVKKKNTTHPGEKDEAEDKKLWSEAAAQMADVHVVENGANPALKVTNKLSYDGKLSLLYLIWIFSFNRRIAKYDMYSFWGKVGIRKYIVCNVSLLGDRFEYTGPGREHLIGFFKVAPILIAIYVPFIKWPESPYTALIPIVIYFLFKMAHYLAMRYRFLRITWRGVRGQLKGSLGKYMLLCIWRTFLNIITLGILIPYSDLKIQRYITNNTYFGKVKASFMEREASLMGVHLISYAIMIGITFLVRMVGGLQITSSNPSFGTTVLWGGPGADSLAVIVVLYFVLLITFLASRLWYRAAFLRHFYSVLQIDTLRFTCDITAGELCQLELGNLAILVGTLGLGIPILIQREMRYFTGMITIIGDINGAAFMQQSSK